MLSHLHYWNAEHSPVATVSLSAQILTKLNIVFVFIPVVAHSPFFNHDPYTLCALLLSSSLQIIKKKNTLRSVSKQLEILKNIRNIAKQLTDRLSYELKDCKLSESHI